MLEKILNIFLRTRFWIIRNLFKSQLRNKSSQIKLGRELVFYDNFNAVSWEGEKWIVSEGWGDFHPDYPYQYFGAPELMEGKSKAKFKVFYNPKTFKNNQVINYEASRISTVRNFSQKYGRWECRCTIPYDRGAWPAFWLWGQTWPPEIDILESFGGKDGDDAGFQKYNLHYGTADNKMNIKANGIRVGRKRQDNGIFHEFACEWEPTKIAMFTDGIKVFQTTDKKVLKWFNSPNVNMWIVLNHAVQIGPVEVAEKEYYSEFLVDYVRVYQ